MDKDYLYMAGLIVSLIAVLYLIKEAQCDARYSYYGKTSFGPIQGCMILTKEGKFIPASALREFDDE